jgi:dTDP-4-dehydrorhamnose reductase
MQLLARLGAGERMRVPADQVSSPTYAPDLGGAIADLAGRPDVTGVLHVAGPDVLDRHTFAVSAARALGLDAGLLDPIETASLGQRAMRPLRAGLLVGRLQTLGIRMRGVADALADLKTLSRLAPRESTRVG